MNLSDFEIPGFGKLGTILAHYRALPILISALEEVGEFGALHKWDKERNKVINIDLHIREA